MNNDERAALAEIESMPFSMVNDAESLRHTIKTIQHIAHAALRDPLPGRLDCGETVAWQARDKVHGGIWRHCDYPHSNPDFEYRPLYALPPTLNSGAVDELIQRHASAYVARGGAISDSIIAECKASREALLAALALPRAVEGGADREKVCAHESCLDCVCPERNFCTGTYYCALPPVPGNTKSLAQAHWRDSK